jgi:hypothetical protein
MGVEEYTDEEVEVVKEMVYAHIDSLGPDEFARAFIAAGNEPRFIMQERLFAYEKRKKEQIKELISYYTSKGTVRLASEEA